MKIGLVLSKTPSYSETFFVSKIKGLQESGFHVTLFVQEKAQGFNLCPVKIAPKVNKRNSILRWGYSLTLLLKLLGHPKRLQRFIKLESNAKRSTLQILKNTVNNAHLLTAHLDWIHFGFATMALQSEHVAKSIEAKLAVSFRGYDIDVYPLKHPDCYKLLWKHVDKVHSISNYLLKKAVELGLSEDKDYQIITPAIDIEKFNTNGIKSSKIVQLLTVARLHWIKGISYTLEALWVLKNKGLEFKYTLIGSGPEYEPLVYTIHQLGLSNVVQLVGTLPHDAIVEHLSNTDVYVQYSDSEGFCNAVLEAQSMGCLTIVSDGGALPENVMHEQTGWVVEKRNPKALAICIEEVINLPKEKKEKISKNAIKRTNEQFSLKLQQKQFLMFYE